MLQKIGFAPGINKQITATTADPLVVLNAFVSVVVDLIGWMS